MTSRTEAIALRLWKLKAASMDLDMIKNYTTPTSPQLSPQSTTTSQSQILLSSPYQHHNHHHHHHHHHDHQHQSSHHHLPPSLISSDEDDRHSMCSSMNSNTSSPLDENAPQNSFYSGVESTKKHTNNNRAASENSSNNKNQTTLPSTTTSQSTTPTSTSSKKNEDLKPTQSYIALIATAILKSKDKRLVLSDIYKHILDNYSYFQSQDKSWRNSIRHNLSLNECFIKVGRSEQGKGHYWAIHPANYDDFSQGDFRRRRARRRVRRSFMDHHHPYTGYPLRPYANLSSRRPSLSSNQRIYRGDSYNGAPMNHISTGGKYQHLAESFLIRSGARARRDYEESKRRISMLSSPKLTRRHSREYTTDFVVAAEASRFKGFEYHHHQEDQDQRLRASPQTLPSNMINNKHHGHSSIAATVADQRKSSRSAAFSIDSLLGNNNNNNRNRNEDEDEVALNILKREDQNVSEGSDTYTLKNKNKDSMKGLKPSSVDDDELFQQQHSYKFPFYFQQHDYKRSSRDVVNDARIILKN